MNFIGASVECFSLLKDAEYWLKRVRKDIIISELSCVNTFLGGEMARSSRALGRCCKLLRLVCRKPSSKGNTTFIYFSIVHVVSAFASLEKLET